MHLPVDQRSLAKYTLVRLLPRLLELNEDVFHYRCMFKSFSFQIYYKIYPTCSRLFVLMPRQAATS